MTLITSPIILKIIQLVKQILKRKINELNEIKKVKTKGKQLIKSQKKLLSLFDDLKTIFNSNNNSNNNESTSNHKSESKNENENENENEKDEYYNEMRQLNNRFETIDQTKSLEEQIELIKKKRRTFK